MKKNEIKLKLFHEIKNSYFTAYQILSNMLNDGPITESDIEHVFLSEDTISFQDTNTDEIAKFISYLINDANDSNTPSLLKSEASLNDSYTSNVISYDDEENEDFTTVPFQLTLYEKRYLKTLLTNNTFQKIIGKEITAKLAEQLSGIKPFAWDKHMIIKGSPTQNDLENSTIQDNLSKLITAIKDKRTVTLTNNTPKGKYENQQIYPYRLMYSPKTGYLQLIAIPKTDDRIILLNVRNITNLKIEEKQHDIKDSHFQELLNNKKMIAEPLRLEVNNKLNGVERAFMLLSDIDKSAYYDENRDVHILELRYYKFDEQDIIQRILYLGQAVTVISPNHIREKLLKLQK